MAIWTVIEDEPFRAAFDGGDAHFDSSRLTK